ncbi:MAG: four helix bundle protein [Nitrospira defluvii]|nr:four helix bundle protein [Nitrospira defluvii]
MNYEEERVVGKDRRKNVIQDKSFAFAVRIVAFCRNLQMEQKEFVLSKQLLRSGTSIGANVEEAIGAQSRKDFAAKMSIAAKEARETIYWLRLLQAAKVLEGSSLDDLVSECREVLTILNSIILTTRTGVKTERAPSSPNIQHSEFSIQNSVTRRREI